MRFANGVSGADVVIQSVLTSSRDDESRKIATLLKENPPDLSLFKEDFRKALNDLIENGITQQFINYVNSYMKPSLEEFTKTNDGSRSSEERWIKIKAEDAPWVEAVLCYNTCLYMRLYGIKELKLCPVCKKFFTNKGKYAKYCSEHCKVVGGVKK